MFCWHCGERLDWDDVICPECGADPDQEDEDHYDDDFPFIDEEGNY